MNQMEMTIKGAHGARLVFESYPDGQWVWLDVSEKEHRISSIGLTRKQVKKLRKALKKAIK